MKRLLILVSCLSICNSVVHSQVRKEIHPVLGKLIDKSPDGEHYALQMQKDCEKLLEKLQNEDENSLSEKEKEIYENCNFDEIDYWDIIGLGCSWYCGGGQDTLSATSELKSSNQINYSASNAHDLNYKTAWVEGVDGYGIGESIIYHFPPQNPTITEIIIVNGYVKSEKIWKDNSRVKKLRMFINEIEIATLNLADSKKEQHFSFEPIGNANGEDWNKLKEKPWWTMRFEIVEVYKGDKYDDTAITEIYFDGIHVH